MSAYAANPDSFIVYGPDANCTLELCPAEASVYQYRPSLAANTSFLVFFAVAFFIHAFLGIKWRTWVFGSVMSLGSYIVNYFIFLSPAVFEVITVAAYVLE